MLTGGDTLADTSSTWKEREAMSETTISPYRIAADEGIDNVWWKAGRVTVKAGAAQTGRDFAQIETDDPYDSGPPRHVHHNEDETFYILDGEVTAIVGDERFDLTTGDYLFAPRGIPHSYVVRSDRARMFVTLSPSGAEELFVSLGVTVEGAEPPTEVVMPPMDELVRLFADYGVEILGPPLSVGDLS
jgi:quercetin dioxygenase-like cupin family protein